MLFLDGPSLSSKGLVLAIQKGYSITADGTILNPSGKELSGCVRNGYLTFCIQCENRTVNVPVHRLQAYQKYGNKIFLEAIVVRHKDSNKLNNLPDNILIGNDSANFTDTPKQLRSEWARNTSICRKYSDAEIKDIRTMLGLGINRKEICCKYNVSNKELSKIALRQIYNHGESNAH